VQPLLSETSFRQVEAEGTAGFYLAGSKLNPEHLNPVALDLQDRLGHGEEERRPRRAHVPPEPLSAEDCWDAVPAPTADAGRG
jgi:hypothetical protein